jgi:hypothetical protein
MFIRVIPMTGFYNMCKAPVLYVVREFDCLI